jgi:hypothetical protein
LVVVRPPAPAFLEAQANLLPVDLVPQLTPAVVCSVEAVVDSAPPTIQQVALAAVQLAALAQVQ